MAGEEAPAWAYHVLGRVNLHVTSLPSARARQRHGSKWGDWGEFSKCLRGPVQGEPCSGMGAEAQS